MCPKSLDAQMSKELEGSLKKSGFTLGGSVFFLWADDKVGLASTSDSACVLRLFATSLQPDKLLVLFMLAE